jgi:2-polyprenyl-6-methoxyphenol hydroxylase-like FAD-dependent oxidoreductase
MSAVASVLIQGGGVGGLACAAALAQRGVAVDVVEAAGPEATLGVGLNQPSNALAALDEIGVREACLDVGFPFEELLFWSPSSVEVAAVPPFIGAYGLPSNNAINRPTYNRILREAAEAAGARMQTGKTVWSLTDTGEGVDVELARWRGRRTPPEQGAGSGRYDLVVGFDGSRSRIREMLFGDTYTPRPTGFAVWRVALPRPAAITHIIMSMAGPVKAVLTPTGPDSMYIALVTPEPGNPRHDPSDFARLLKDRMAPFSGLIGAMRDGISATDIISYAPLESVTVREPWFRGRVAIAGDAAHSSPPHLAQGAAMAVEDAVTLAAALDAHSDVQAALAAWFERRRERALFVADMSLVLLKQETGGELVGPEAELAAMGIGGAMSRLALEHY